jgi:hypothetical protein
MGPLNTRQASSTSICCDAAAPPAAYLPQVPPPVVCASKRADTQAQQKARGSLAQEEHPAAEVRSQRTSAPSVPMMKWQWRQSKNKYTRARNYKSWASVGLGVAGLRLYLDRLASASRLVLPSISPKFHCIFEAPMRDGRQHTYTSCIASAKR